MMVIYVNMEMITNMVLHFHYKKVGFYFRNRKLLNNGWRKIPLLEYWQISWAQSSGSHYRKLLNY